jgi:hypothetical protein
MPIRPRPLADKDHDLWCQQIQPSDKMLGNARHRQLLVRFPIVDSAATDHVAVRDVVKREITLIKRKVTIRDWPMWDELAQDPIEFRVACNRWLVAKRPESGYVIAIE